MKRGWHVRRGLQGATRGAAGESTEEWGREDTYIAGCEDEQQRKERGREHKYIAGCEEEAGKGKGCRGGADVVCCEVAERLVSVEVGRVRG